MRSVPVKDYFQFFHFYRILEPVCLYPAGEIDGIRVHSAHCICDISGIQPSGKEEFPMSFRCILIGVGTLLMVV